METFEVDKMGYIVDEEFYAMDISEFSRAVGAVTEDLGGEYYYNPVTETYKLEFNHPVTANDFADLLGEHGVPVKMLDDKNLIVQACVVGTENWTEAVNSEEYYLIGE